MVNMISQRRVLVVDDEPSNITVLREVLRQKYTIIAASTGRGALSMAAASPRPDLILLDIAMPDMDGFEVCRRLKSDSSLEDIPVIFISALAETKDKVLGFKVGGADYITKPFQPEEVVARVSTHLELLEQRRQNDSHLKTMEEELKWAGEMQKAILKPNLPRSERIDFRVSYKPVPSLYCGGDYYDVVFLSADRYLLLIGDVAGHGVRAALVTAILKAVIYPEYLRTSIDKRFSPGAFLGWLNDRMNFELRSATGIIITFFAGLIDLKAGTLRYANAGQPHPIILREGKAIELSISGTGLGIVASMAYAEQTVPIKSKDLMILYTDGLIEIGCAQGIAPIKPLPLFERVEYSRDYHFRLLEAALADGGQATFDDDVTIVTAWVT